jgi:hypothetical protein
MTPAGMSQKVELLEITHLLGYHTARSAGGLCCGREKPGSYTEPDNLWLGGREMMWFIRYRFTYPASVTNAKQRLLESLEKHGLKHSDSESQIKIEKKLALFFLNSWNPIFVGRFERDQGQTCFCGYFRLHWYTMMFSVFFLGMLLYQLLVAFQQPDARPGNVPGWKAQEIEFGLTFIAMFFGITFIGWLFGLPNARRILAAIRESTATQPGAPADGERLRRSLPSQAPPARRG